MNRIEEILITFGIIQIISFFERGKKPTDNNLTNCITRHVLWKYHVLQIFSTLGVKN